MHGSARAPFRTGMMPRLVLTLSLALISVRAVADCAPPPAVRAVPAAGSGELSLATLNLWRLRDSDKDARYDEPLAPGRVEARLQALAGMIHERLGAPHLLAVQEVENRTLLRRLARAVAEHGPDYRTLLREGHDPSGLDVGLLYRAPVRIKDHEALFAERKQQGQWLFSRPPLRVRVQEPLVFDLVVVHLRSAHGLDEPDERARVRAKRKEQARVLRHWVGKPVRRDPPVVLAGDFNSAPGDALYAEPWQRMHRGLGSVWDHLPAHERFSHIHDCQRQAIDHIFYSDALKHRATDAAISRGNAGHYRTLYGAHGTDSAVSDHDAPVLYFDVEAGSQ